LKFGGERLRPAHDLLARVPLEAPRTIADLGCGTGTVTALIRTRWPQARITGIDNSPQMLERARATLPDVVWEAADLSQWTPAGPIDLIVSNAALHWLDDHGALFPRLISRLAKGGVLAVQMPAQHTEPSHLVGYDLAESARYRDALKGMVRRRPVLDAVAYYDIIRPRVRSLDLWSVEYVQMLTGDNPVAEFTKGSFVGVWLSALASDDARDFEAEYRARIAAAYPKRQDGVTLFPFRRFFIVACR
jgi:trans-aconitate 2-methyltransferase